MSLDTRMQDVRSLWVQYPVLYTVGGIMIGLICFPLIQLVITDLSSLIIGLIPEAVGIVFTVFFVDSIYQHRATEALKKRLIREAASQSNETAKSAVDWLRHEGWLTGQDSLLQYADLSRANLVGSLLSDANLAGINPVLANLEPVWKFKGECFSANMFYKTK